MEGGSVVPRSSQRRVLHRHPSHTGRAADGRERQRVPRLGHSNEGGDHGAGRTSRNGPLRSDAGRRAAGGDWVCGRDGANVGLGDGQCDVGSDAPQEGSALVSVPSGVTERRGVKGREYVFATASADNIKKWKCPKVRIGSGVDA